MTTEQQFARITDEMIVKLKERIGVPRRPRNIWNTVATKDAIRHWAWGIGDDNPLFLDEEYAAKGPYGGLIAPPTFLYSNNHGPYGPGSKPSRGGGMPGIHGLHLYDSWAFYEPVRVDTPLTPTEYVAAVEEKTGKYAERMVLQRTEVDFTDDQGTLLAKNSFASMKTERGTPKDKAKYADITKWVYTPEELAQIDHDYENEVRRGAVPRYWEDVQVGDDIGYVVKGPLTVLSMMTYWMGWGCIFGMTDKIAHDYLKLHPGANVPHPDTNVPDFPERGHWGDPFVHELGFPLGYDIGTQRIGWFAHLMTNWQGDHGFLRALTVRLRSPNWLGDTTWLRGRVTDKRITDGEHMIDCEVWATSQRGVRHAEGEATVRLMSRGS
ncbi:MAG: MaoC family dehydratase N-terminal domain-containing protein [Dehalococcoidia bacterium]